MAGLSAVSVTASTAKTVSGNSAALRVPSGSGLAVLADVTAVSGTTPSLTLTVEWSHDGITFVGADTADTFTAITTAAGKAKRFETKGEWFRVVWTITGTTPSFTFSGTAYGV